MTEDEDILGMIGKGYMASGGMSAAGSFANMMAGSMDYTNAMIDAGNLSVQASNIELQAQQQANMLREQFVNAVGTLTYSAARRGVDVGSMSVQDNVENSAIAMGQDIQRLQQNTAIKANALRARQQMIKKAANLQKNLSYVKGFTSLLSSVGTFMTGYELANAGDISSGSTFNPATSAPGKKPF